MSDINTSSTRKLSDGSEQGEKEKKVVSNVVTTAGARRGRRSSGCSCELDELLLHPRPIQERLLQECIERVLSLFNNDNNDELDDDDDDDSREEESSELILVTGPSGVGKSLLAREVCERLQHTSSNSKKVQISVLQGIWEGPDDEHDNDISSFGAFIKAFESFPTIWSAQFKSDEHLREFQDKVYDATMGEVNLLISVIPSLGDILLENDHQKIIRPGLSGIHHQCMAGDGLLHFQRVFTRFLVAVCSFETPIVLLLENLQNADRHSLDLLSSILTDASIEGLAVVCTCRDDEISMDDDVAVMLRGLEDNLHIRVSEIALGNLREDETHEIVAKTLGHAKTECNTLTRQVYERTRGNLFEINQLMHTIAKLDLTKTSVFFEASTNTLEERFKQLPIALTEWLQVAACLGRPFLPTHVDLSLPETKLAGQLNAALDTGWIEYLEPQESSCTFVHKRIWEFCYGRIPCDDRPKAHLDIGRRMWKRLTRLNEVEPHCIVIACQLQKGLLLIVDPEERIEVCKLFFLAGQRAEKESRFRLAASLLETSCDLLPSRNWRDHYSLSLNIFNAAAEAAFVAGSMERSEYCVNEILSNARSLEDKLAAYAVQIYVPGTQTHYQEAIKRGVHVLGLLKANVPRTVGPVRVVLLYKRITRLLRNKSIEELLDLPIMTDPIHLGTMKVLNISYVYAFVVDPRLASLIALRLVELTLKHGLCAMSATGFAFFGILKCLVVGSIEEGYRCAILANSVLQRFQAPEWLPRVLVATGLINTSILPMRECITPLQKSHHLGIATGDIVCSMLALEFSAAVEFFGTRATLQDCFDRFVGYRELMATYGVKDSLLSHSTMVQLVANLMGRCGNHPLVLSGDYSNELDVLAHARNEKLAVLLYIFYFLKGMIAFWMNEYSLAEELFQKATKTSTMASLFSRCFIATARGAANLLLARRSRLGRHRRINIAKRCLRFLRTNADLTPENYMHKVNFLQAHMALLHGRLDETLTRFETSERLAKSGGTLFEEALAVEHAGLSLCEYGRLEEGVGRLRKAQHIYEEWGAAAKVIQLHGIIATYSADSP